LPTCRLHHPSRLPRRLSAATGLRRHFRSFRRSVFVAAHRACGRRAVSCAARQSGPRERLSCVRACGHGESPRSFPVRLFQTASRSIDEFSSPGTRLRAASSTSGREAPGRHYCRGRIPAKNRLLLCFVFITPRACMVATRNSVSRNHQLNQFRGAAPRTPSALQSSILPGLT
jgi:hypothetical protein